MGIAMRTLGKRVLCAAVVWVAATTTAFTADWDFRVSWPKSVHAEPYTGRVYVFFSRKRAQPRTGPNWFGPEPFIARDVRNWPAGQPVSLSAGDESVLAFPQPLAELKLEGYAAQAVVRFAPHERLVGRGPGNGFSEPLNLEGERRDVSFEVTKVVPPRKFQETKWTKLLSIRSQRLSDFHDRDVRLNAAVILPAGYHEQPQRKYPVIYTVPGFGGTHFDAVRRQPVSEENAQGVEFVRVMLDPSCPRGHHVFADSANNGPYGTALVEELIPALEEEFRVIPQPTARFLTGHSSGGWSTLWLQVRHPEVFAGTWSTAPDPVDFRDFQRIDLYQEGENVYRDADGKRRPLARANGRVVLWYEDFDQMEHVLGYGGQLHSFEAVFSPRGKDGKPLRAWSRKTGEVDTDVTRHWQDYDIRLVLERNWETLGPKLEGKLHVVMGTEDTFYLEGATRLLKESLERLGSDAEVELVPGKNHFNLLTPALRKRIRGEMVARFLEAHGEWPGR